MRKKSTRITKTEMIKRIIEYDKEKEFTLTELYNSSTKSLKTIIRFYELGENKDGK